MPLIQKTILHRRSLLRARRSAVLGIISLRKKGFDFVHQLARGGDVILLVEVFQAAFGDFSRGHNAALDESVRILRGVLPATGRVDVQVGQVGVPREGHALKLVIGAANGNGLILL